MITKAIAPPTSPSLREPDYFAPSSVLEVLDLLARHGGRARLLGGGQTLVPQLAAAPDAFDAVVDLRRVAGLRNVDIGKAQAEVGAMVTVNEARRALADRFPVVEHCLGRTANAAIRNRATVGGSVALRDPASELSSFLVAYKASAVIAGSPERSIPVADLLRAPPSNALIRLLRIPVPARQDRAGFAEILRRKSGGRSLAMALARCSDRQVSLTVSGGGCQPLRLAGPSLGDVLDQLRDHLPTFGSAAVSAWAMAAAARAFDEARR